MVLADSTFDCSRNKGKVLAFGRISLRLERGEGIFSTFKSSEFEWGTLFVHIHFLLHTVDIKVLEITEIHVPVQFFITIFKFRAHSPDWAP